MPEREDDEPQWEDDTEGPWDEQRWETFMRESDLRSARFGEIFETVMDDPNRDRIIAREMGWDWLEEALDEQEAARAAGELDEDEDEFKEPDVPERAAAGSQDSEATDAGDDEEDDDPFGDRECDRIPAYRIAFDNSMKIHDALKPFMSKEVNEKDEDYDRRLGQAYIGCHIAAAKIAGGHAMGYDPDVLCGNIVNCKRGLAGAVEAEEGLLELKEEGLLPAGLVDSLLPEVRAVIDAVKARIEELRAKVWW
jgi:hypothetical protein